MRNASAQSEARKTADRRHGRSKLVISLLKRTFEKVQILVNNRGIFMEGAIRNGMGHFHKKGQITVKTF